MKNDIKDILRNLRRLSGEDVVCFVLTLVPVAMIFLGMYIFC